MNFEILPKLEATGSGVIVIPDEDWSIHMITVEYDSGTDVIVKIGTFAGGNDIIFGLNISSLDPLKVVNTHMDCEGGTTLYYTIEGTAAQVDMYLQLIKNRQ